MQKILIFGATGGIGGELLKLYKDQDVNGLGSKEFNFSNPDFKKGIENLSSIKKLMDDADIIINSAGILGSDNEPYEHTFDVNFNSNFIILKYLLNKHFKSSKKFVIIGSMAYSHGRDDFMLYAASKAALYNLFLSAKKYLDNGKSSSLIVGIVNPPKVKTQMIANLSTIKNIMTAEKCAKKIFDFTENLSESISLDLA